MSISSSDMSIDSGYTAVIHQDRRILTNKEESVLQLILGPANRILQHVLSLVKNKRTTPYIAIEVRLHVTCFVHYHINIIHLTLFLSLLSPRL